jgi:hypothetical protein
MQNFTELLVMELGMFLEPFQEEYTAYHYWVTHLWVKLVQEKASWVWVVIEIADLLVHPPQERDSWLIQEPARLNYSSKTLRRLNCV